jgi:hypothetical protein
MAEAVDAPGREVVARAVMQRGGVAARAEESRPREAHLAVPGPRLGCGPDDSDMI